MSLSQSTKVDVGIEIRARKHLYNGDTYQEVTRRDAAGRYDVFSKQWDYYPPAAKYDGPG
jgi:hypothetical protein